MKEVSRCVTIFLWDAMYIGNPRIFPLGYMFSIEKMVLLGGPFFIGDLNPGASKI